MARIWNFGVDHDITGSVRRSYLMIPTPLIGVKLRESLEHIDLLQNTEP